MKTWTMPRIAIEGYAANEYVAACETDTSGIIHITCDSHRDSNGHVTSIAGDKHHLDNYSGANCPATLAIPVSEWSKFTTKKAWFDSSGKLVSTGMGAPGDEVYYYVEKRNDGIVWDKYTDGYGNYHNHFVSGSVTNPVS